MSKQLVVVAVLALLSWGCATKPATVLLTDVSGTESPPAKSDSDGPAIETPSGDDDVARDDSIDVEVTESRTSGSLRIEGISEGEPDEADAEDEDEDETKKDKKKKGDDEPDEESDEESDDGEEMGDLEL